MIPAALRAEMRAAFPLRSRSAFGVITGVLDYATDAYHRGVEERLFSRLGMNRTLGVLEAERDRRRGTLRPSQ